MSKTFADLVAFLAGFSHDPYRFVLAAFPWGEGELAGKSGPDEWQRDVLNDIRDGLRTPDSVIREAVASGNGIGKAQRLTDVIDTPAGPLPAVDGVDLSVEIISLAATEARRRSFNAGGMNPYRSTGYILTMVLT